jgi:hypothetical protein
VGPFSNGGGGEGRVPFDIKVFDISHIVYMSDIMM